MNGEPTLFDRDGSSRPATDDEIRAVLGGDLCAAWQDSRQADAEDGAQ